MAAKQSRIRIDRPNIVGIADTPCALKIACRAPVDLVEVRADALATLPGVAQIKAIGRPVLVTVRCREEGGVRALANAERAAMYEALLPAAAAIDIELRSVRTLAGVVGAARRAGRKIVVSMHDFAATPPTGRLMAAMARARDAGADVVKFATRTDSPGDVARLLAVLERADGPVAVMGMGRLGRASRLLFAGCGSVLNYGFLDKANVPGQWSARQLRELLQA